MGKKLYPTDTLKQAQNILVAWNQIDPSLKIGPVSADGLSADLAMVQELQETIRRMEIELSNARYQRDMACIGIWDKVKRTRSGIKGLYGDDSTEYQIAGGTRRSERKKPRQKISRNQAP